MSGSEKEHGEGNYKASRQYNEATKKFVESGKVDEAARNAAPRSESEASQMAESEAKGRSRAKEEDPALLRKSGEKQGEGGPRGGSPSGRSAEPTKIPEPGQE